MIGIFDSGIGGLTVVRELLRQAPDMPFAYLGDTARTPYGNKSPETVIRYALEDADFLVKRGAEAIVMACNSASAVATDALRQAYPSLHVFEVITPAVEDALALTRGSIGVIGTRATISSGVYEKRLSERNSKIKITAKACPLFVPLVEEGWLDEGETKRIARHYLRDLRQAQVDTLILGCTHYPLIAPVIQRAIGSKVKLVDSGASVVKRVLEQVKPVKNGGQEYFLTDISGYSTAVAQKWLNRSIKFEKADLQP